MPAPVAWFAEHQPVTSIVDTIRALVVQRAVGTEIWTALGWILGVLLAAYGTAMVLYRKRVG